MSQRADEASAHPCRSVCLVKVPYGYLHSVKRVDLIEPHRQACSQALRREKWQHAEIEVDGVAPIREVELAQRRAPFETKGLR